jgi:hypothetical protein
MSPNVISVTIHTDTRAKLNRFVAQHDVAEDEVVDRALRAWLDAQELEGASAVVLSVDEMERLADRLAAPPTPTEALRRLMHGQ